MIKHVLLAFFLGVFVLAARANGSELKVLAGTELKDMAPLIDDIEKATGVRLKFEYTGSRDGAKAIAEDASRWDAAWFASSIYIRLVAPDKTVTMEFIMQSPVIFGVKESVARRLGWIERQPSWKEIADKAASGQFRFAMTDPRRSNSGFAGLLSVTTALSNRRGILTEADIANTTITDFFKGHLLNAESSEPLVKKFVRDQDGLDGMINYESVLLEVNEKGALKEKLILVYPAEGVVKSDYPLILLNSSKLKDYKKVVDYLLSDAAQRKIIQRTRRRPAVSTVKPDFPTPQPRYFTLPDRWAVVEQLLLAFAGQHRKLTHIYFLLDKSASMNEENRIVALKEAFYALLGDIEEGAWRESRFTARDKLTIITFDTVPEMISPDFEFPSAPEDDSAGSPLRTFIVKLQADGSNTAMYDALIEAYRQVEQARSRERDRTFSIVLLTDGKRNHGSDLAAFKRFMEGLGPDLKRVPTFAILFGEASKAELEAIAAETGGEVFDGTKSLREGAIKRIRGYQ